MMSFWSDTYFIVMGVATLGRRGGASLLENKRRPVKVRWPTVDRREMADGFSAQEDNEDFDYEDQRMGRRPEPGDGLRERVVAKVLGPFKSPQLMCSPCCTFPTSYGVAEPRDHYNLVYVCMLMAGVGFLLPWSSYISAIDYFFYLYHSDFSTVSEAIPVTYLLTTLFFSTINIGLVNLFSIHARIRFGYVMFTLSLVFIPLLDIGINNCTVSTHASYYLTLISIVAVGIGSGGKS